MSAMYPRRLPHACLILAALAAACAGRGGPAAAPQLVDERPMPTDTDERLRWALADVRAPGRLTALAALEDSLRDLDARLGRLVADSTMPPAARSNAVALLGERQATRELIAFWSALEAPEVRVRAATAGALRGIIVANEGAGLRLARRALRDPARAVQARALEAIGDTDLQLLRDYVASEPPPDLAKVATELVRIAEGRGAPLIPAGAGTGGGDATAKAAAPDGTAYVLSRTSASGPHLEFRAAKRWPQWDAAVGELVVTRPGAAPVVVSGEVEAVGGVVPAFFSVDGRYLVYEAAREVRVRDLRSGEERALGRGIAPRVVPFSDWFVFLRDDPERREQGREGATIRYAVLRASFTDDEILPIGDLQATLRMTQRGFYSPVRWMRVRERDGVFTLEGESLVTFQLPDPFAALGGST